jgi:hypothetical protein
MGLAKKKSTGKPSPKNQIQKTKIIKSPATPAKSGKKSPKPMDFQHPKKVQTPKDSQLSGKKSKKGKKLSKNIPVKSESEDEESDDVIIEDDSDVEEIKASPIKEGKLKAQHHQKEKKSLKKKDKEVAVRAPKRKLATSDDDNEKMDVDEAKPAKRSRDDKWLTTLDKEILDETIKRELERSHRSLFFFEPKVPIPDKDMKALSSDILFIQKKYPKKTKSAGYLVFADKETCQANFEKLQEASIGGVKLRFSLYKESASKDWNKDIKVNSLKLVVNNLQPATTKGDLKKAFPNATHVYRHLKSPHTAYVYFYSPECAREAFNTKKDTIIRGSKVVVTFAIPKRARDERGPDADLVRKIAATKYVRRHGYVNQDLAPKKKITKDKTAVVA